MAGVERIHHRASLRRRGLVAKAAQGRSAPLLRDDSVRAGVADPELVTARPEQLPGELARAQRGLPQLVHVGVVCVRDLAPAGVILVQAGVHGNLPSRRVREAAAGRGPEAARAALLGCQVRPSF